MSTKKSKVLYHLIDLDDIPDTFDSKEQMVKYIEQYFGQYFDFYSYHKGNIFCLKQEGNKLTLKKIKINVNIEE